MTEHRYLLDSNILIYLLRGQLPTLRERVEAHASGELVTSAISYAEVMRGIDPINEQQATAAGLLFTVVEVLPFDRAAAASYSLVPFKRGQFDRLIAAQALAAGLILVTDNITDFTDIPGLTVENWTR